MPEPMKEPAASWVRPVSIRQPISKFGEHLDAAEQIRLLAAGPVPRRLAE
jgi:hypothetical protein